MTLSIYCSECDEYTEIDKISVYKEHGGITVQCDHCDDKKDV